ncbi:hypothetical protein L0F63_005173 [Massospora cicadina]|nr:hypothetical protein L0F63_005173 [Massospora cicadina]
MLDDNRLTFPSHTLAPIKDIVKKELDITNTEFGLLQSSELLFQTLTPFIGGAVADVVGPGRSSLLATGAILSGELLLVFASTALPIKHQFLVLNIGQLLFGLGAGWIVTVLELILVRAFPQHTLALAMGTLFAMAKLSGFLATGVAVHIVEWLGFYGGVFWVGLGFALTSLLASAVYAGLSRQENFLPREEKEQDQEREDSFTMLELTTATCSNEAIHDNGATWTPYVHLVSNITKYMYTLSDVDAAWQASLVLSLPILLGPIFGFILDRVSQSPAPQPYFGKDIVNFCTHILACLGSLFVVLAFFLMDSSVVFSPYPSLVLFALALGCGPLALATLAPLLVKPQQPGKPLMLGALIGMQSSITHMVSSLMDTVTGWVQDHYATLNPTDPRNGYTQVMTLFKFLACTGFLSSLLFIFVWFPPTFIKPKFSQHRWSEIAQVGSRPDFPLRRYVYLAIALLIFAISWGTFILVLAFAI